MAKKQTRRSISVSRVTYERLKAFCEANNISMSQFVETRVGEALPTGDVIIPVSQPRPVMPAPMPMPRPMTAPVSMPRPVAPAPLPPKRELAPAPAPSSLPVPMTSAAARFAVEPPPPIIKQKQETAAPKPAEKRPDQIFTF
jgi:hypothetical protein|nr:hypothetical protein [Kofleriaceae bacterium]